jgi:hypothetical protein
VVVQVALKLIWILPQRQIKRACRDANPLIEVSWISFDIEAEPRARPLTEPDE